MTDSSTRKPIVLSSPNSAFTIVRSEHPRDWSLFVHHGRHGHYGETTLDDASCLDVAGEPRVPASFADVTAHILSSIDAHICELAALRERVAATQEERRAPVQAEKDKPRGTIAWWEHLIVYAAYAEKYGKSQSAERIAERQGFGYYEACKLIGRSTLVTWEAV